ncbi:MAG: MBL fold metallo-hydrolase [Patescibacteria group bacterium]
MRRLTFFLLLVVPVVLVFSLHPKEVLTVAFLDVGQGDAIFIESPSGVQVLVDGGATRGVLREIRSVMPFYDRTIDVVVSTHPDQDHVGGLSYVLDRYQVGTVIESGNSADTPAQNAFTRARDAEGAREVVARRGMRLLLGDGAYADILFPDRDVSGVESNTASIVLRVAYGGHSFLLTGDAPHSIEKYLFSIYGKNLESDVLKAGHHGSRTSSNETFVKAVNPSYVVFSRGCDNRYGHPSRDVVELFKRLSVTAFDTCTNGTVTFVADGKSLKVR